MPVKQPPPVKFHLLVDGDDPILWVLIHGELIVESYIEKHEAVELLHWCDKLTDDIPLSFETPEEETHVRSWIPIDESS